ncbi:MAG: DUF748 domain-containing protein [bacterium]|nr:DUF748 domain-containing protein [bacterium]
MQKKDKYSKKRIFLRLIIYFLFIFCLTSGVLYVYLTEIVKNLAISLIYEKTNLDIGFGDFKLKIITGEIEIGELSFRDASLSKEPFFTAESVKAGINIRALLSGHLWINYMALENPVLRIERNKEKAVNIFEIRDRLDFKSGEGPVRHNFLSLQIGTLSVSGGSIRYKDDFGEKQFTLEADNINIILKKFYLPPPGEDKCAELMIEADVGDAPESIIRIKSKFNPAEFAKDFEIDVHIDNVVLNRFSSYYNPASPIIIDGGKASVFYRGSCRDGELVGGGVIELEEVVVRAKEGPISPQLYGVAVEKVITYVAEHKDMKFRYTLTGCISDPQFRLAPGTENVIINSILNALDIPVKAAGNIKEGIGIAGENISNGVKKIKDKISNTVNGVVDYIGPSSK